VPSGAVAVAVAIVESFSAEYYFDVSQDQTGMFITSS
jgi:hypothetical protein